RISQLPPDAKEWRRAPIADKEKFDELKARAARLGKTLPSDKTLESSQKLLEALPRSCVARDPDPPDAQQARNSLAKQSGNRQ
ncbi:MAG: hypothetical protein ACREJC_12165, partial [Tepidisphaeraceae bacterium]